MLFYRICIAFCCCLCYKVTLAELPRSLDSLFKGGVAFYEQEKYIRASERFEFLLAEAKQNGDYAVQIELYEKLATFYEGKGNHDKSLEYIFNIIDIANYKLDTTVYSVAERNKIIYDNYNFLSEVYYHQGDYNKSEEYLMLVYSLIKDQEENINQARTLNNIGEIKRLKGETQEGLEFYKKSLNIRKKLPDSLGLSITLANVGVTYIELGVLDSAKFFLDWSFEIIQAIDFTKMQVDISRGYMNYYQALGQFELASQWGQRALKYTQKYPNINIQLPIYKDLAVVYDSLKRFDYSSLFYKKWIDLNETISKQNHDRLALEIEARFLIKEKEKELSYLREKDKIKTESNQLKNYFQWMFILGLIGVLVFTLGTLNLLKKKNKSLANSWEKINQQNTEKNLLLKEIHHRVKNNLQVITSLLSLQSYTINDPTIKALFNQSQHRINSMAMIHKMLYQSNDFSKISAKDYLEELVTKLVISFKGAQHNIEINFDLPDVFINIDTSIPLGLLINEVVTNALKYGLPDDQAGSLILQMKRLETSKFLLEIGDDGLGYNGDLKYKGDTSLGLRLIQQLAVQMNGKITKLEVPQGTYYRLEFEEVESA